MTSDTIRNFPELSQIRLARDAVEYEYQTGVDVYDIKKGPATKIYAVTSNGTVFIEGTDYTTNTNSDGDITSIDFSVGGKSPSGGDIFTIDQEYESVLSRFVESHDIEFEQLEGDLDEIVSIRQIDNASGDELDRIGRIFGVLGRRSNRTDQDYRLFLKSIVQSFSGRGSVAGLKFAAAAGLGTTADQIGIVEDFENLEYDIIIDSWPEHNPAVITELAELADPSAVGLSELKYQVTEESQADDSFEIQENESVEEDVTSSDTTVEGANTHAVSDDSTMDDATATTQRATNTATWESSTTSGVNWSFFEWTTS